MTASRQQAHLRQSHMSKQDSGEDASNKIARKIFVKYVSNMQIGLCKQDASFFHISFKRYHGLLKDL